MPAPEGFAAVGQQLSAVRRRANRQALVAAVCGVAAIVVGLATAVVAVGVWGSGSVFRLTVGAALAVAAVAVGSAARYARRHWIDLPAAARVADRRAELHDRLTTVATLPPDAGDAPLAPLLIAQTMALHDRWHPETVVPRRVPRSAVALLAALAVLGGMLLWLRLQPLARWSQARSAAAPTPPASRAEHRDPAHPPRSLPPGDRPEDASLASAGAAAPNDSGDPADADDFKPGDAAETADAASNPLVVLPAQLQQAIRAAVHGESAGRPQSVATGVKRPADASGDAQPGRGGTTGAATPGTAQDVTARQGKDVGDRPQPDGEQQPSGATSRPAGLRPARPNEAGRDDEPRDGTPKPPGGAAPPAGRGSSAGNLLGQQPGGTVPGAPDATAPFKVTITSFLKALDQQPTSQRPAARRTGAGAAPRPAPALSDAQLADDLLRKAEVPPEHEELVRRVYSTREER